MQVIYCLFLIPLSLGSDRDRRLLNFEIAPPSMNYVHHLRPVILTQFS